MHNLIFLGHPNILLIAAILHPVAQLQLPHTMLQATTLMPPAGVPPHPELTMPPMTPKTPHSEVRLPQQPTNFQMTTVKLHPVVLQQQQQLIKTLMMDQAPDQMLITTHKIHGKPTKYSILVLCIGWSLYVIQQNAKNIFFSVAHMSHHLE